MILDRKEKNMFKIRSLAGILLVVAVLFAQVGTVFAAPPAQDTTPITGTVTALDKETDSNGVTTAVLVTVQDDLGATQTYRISVDTAVALGLATVDPTTQEVTLKDLSQETEPVIVTIDPTTVIADEEPVVHPIAAFLASFFKVDPVAINDLHLDGFGFGVIAQALWMSESITETGIGDATAAGCILDAKRNGTYGDCFSFGDDPVPTNWGQFKKALLDNKQKHNLGYIVSGHASDDESETLNAQLQHGNGKDKKKDKGNGHGNGNRP
jgi:hypothetical protein